MALFTKFWRGQFPLASTFWLGWVVPLLGTYIALSLVSLWIIRNFGLSSVFVLAFLSVSIAIISTLAVWRSATTYAGHKVFKFGARATTLLGTSLQIFSLAVLAYVAVVALKGIESTHDDYRIAENTAIPSETHPMAGFWKTQSSENFGLAVSPAGAGKYSVSFCGPGGCFKPGTYRPDTPLVGDEDYQVINPNTLRVKGSDGWTTYHRAPSRGEQCATEPSPIRLETSKLSPGLLIKFQVNNLPVFVLNRRPNEIASLRQSYAGSKEQVASCAACDPVLRSISPNYLVVWGYNPSSGCELIYASSTATDWGGHSVHGRGGFVDKCSATEYDLTGRKLVGPKTSPNELRVPPHSFRKGVIEIEAKPTSKL